MADPNQADPNQAEGDLIAHLHNDGKRSIQKRLAASPDVAQELAALEKLDTLLHNTYGGSALPNPQDMVDVLMDQATPTQKLIVAAYVRDSVRGKREMEALRNALAAEPSTAEPSTEKTEAHGKSGLPRFIAKPMAVGIGLRSQGDGSEQQTFQVDALQAQVTLRVVPPIREIWEIEGYVTQNYVPVADAHITLQSDQTSPQSSRSDSEGFFAFRKLAAGQYSLHLHLADGIITLSELVLLDEDE